VPLPARTGHFKRERRQWLRTGDNVPSCRPSSHNPVTVLAKPSPEANGSGQPDSTATGVSRAWSTLHDHDRITAGRPIDTLSVRNRGPTPNGLSDRSSVDRTGEWQRSRSPAAHSNAQITSWSCRAPRTSRSRSRNDAGRGHRDRPFVATRGSPMPSPTAIATPRRERPTAGVRGRGGVALSASFSATGGDEVRWDLTGSEGDGGCG
jgi:hypothetical protein